MAGFEPTCGGSILFSLGGGGGIARDGAMLSSQSSLVVNARQHLVREALRKQCSLLQTSFRTFDSVTFTSLSYSLSMSLFLRPISPLCFK